jgi:hypothetical protein
MYPTLPGPAPHPLEGHGQLGRHRKQPRPDPTRPASASLVQVSPNRTQQPRERGTRAGNPRERRSEPRLSVLWQRVELHAENLPVAAVANADLHERYLVYLVRVGLKRALNEEHRGRNEPGRIDNVSGLH